MSKIVIWEWQEDDGSWIPYGPKNSNAIERALNSGKESITISIYVEYVDHIVEYNIDLKELEQENPITGKRRRIKQNRLGINSALGSNVSWEWRKRNRIHLYESFSTELIEELESAYLTNPTTFMIPAKYGKPYTIDFQRMRQTNNDTNNKRKIRRVNLDEGYLTNSLSHKQSVARVFRASSCIPSAPLPSDDNAASSPIGANGFQADQPDGNGVSYGSLYPNLDLS